MTIETDEPVRITMRSAHEVTISNLTGGERETLESAMRGLAWVRRGTDGRLETMQAFHALKGPADDEEMLPFWRPLARTPGVAQQYELFEFGELHPNAYPSIIIRYLCGYYYTPEKYREEAAKLESWGFDCLRSRRGKDGTYLELWYLSSLLFATGEFKRAIEWREEVERDEFGYEVLLEPKITPVPIPKHKQHDAALAFLQRHGLFGTCDVSVQRLAMGTDD